MALPAASPTALQQPLLCSQPRRQRVRAQQLLLRPAQKLLHPVRRLWQAAAQTVGREAWKGLYCSNGLNTQHLHECNGSMQRMSCVAHSSFTIVSWSCRPYHDAPNECPVSFFRSFDGHKHQDKL